MNSSSISLPVLSTHITADGDNANISHEQARILIHYYTLTASGIGFIPFPLFDQVSISALLGKMIHDLGRIYDVPTPEYRTKAIISAILGGAHTQWITYYLIGVATLLLPGVGFLGSLAVRPLLSGAITHTMGHIFMRQFANGKTLETFDTVAAAQDFNRGFEEGKIFMRKQFSSMNTQN
ncbi:DUF697 domain-containing protein [Gammaproteobacteria bacterium]